MNLALLGVFEHALVFKEKSRCRDGGVAPLTQQFQQPKACTIPAAKCRDDHAGVKNKTHRRRLQKFPPTEGRTTGLDPAPTRYTRHEVTAPRAVGPSGRTLIELSSHPRYTHPNPACPNQTPPPTPPLKYHPEAANPCSKSTPPTLRSTPWKDFLSRARRNMP